MLEYIRESMVVQVWSVLEYIRESIVVQVWSVLEYIRESMVVQVCWSTREYVRLCRCVYAGVVWLCRCGSQQLYRLA